MIMTCSIISLVLLIWFRTDAWLEYCRLFGLDCISFYSDYEKKKYNDVTLTYHIYLRRYHDSFFIRLITCPICLSVWLGIVFILAKAAIGFLFLGFLAAFLILLDLPILILVSLAIYGIIDRLLG